MSDRNVGGAEESGISEKACSIPALLGGFAAVGDSSGRSAPRERMFIWGFL